MSLPSTAPGPRARFREARARAALGAGAVGGSAALALALLAAPQNLAGIRLLDVGLGWWAAGFALGIQLGVLAHAAARSGR